MGVELIVTRKDQLKNMDFAAGQQDHKILPQYLDQLNELAAHLKVPAISDFFDEAGAEFDLYEEIHGEEPPEDWLEKNRQWFDPAEGINSLRSILEALKQERPSHVKTGHAGPLIEELEDCLAALQTLASEGDLFCFSIFI